MIYDFKFRLFFYNVKASPPEMEGVVQGRDNVSHVSDEVCLAGNERLDLWDEGLVCGFFSHDSWELVVLFCEMSLIDHGAGEGIELDIAFLCAGSLVNRSLRIGLCTFRIGQLRIET